MRFRLLRLLSPFLGVFLFAPLMAQTVPPAPKAAAPAPFTEIEALRIQNVNLEGVIVQRALQDWQAKVAALKADLEKTRKGWEWTPETGQWTAIKDPK